jgi:hypothetical protein
MPIYISADPERVPEVVSEMKPGYKMGNGIELPRPGYRITKRYVMELVDESGPTGEYMEANSTEELVSNWAVIVAHYTQHKAMESAKQEFLSKEPQ